MRARWAWRVYGVGAATLAAVAAGLWLWAVLLRGPVLYGEGAVAHAAILARDHLEYTLGAHYGDVSPIFTAANYPPLYLQLAGLGDPFVVGRILSIAATVFVAGAVAWRARSAGVLVAATIALAWLGSVPVLAWAPAVKPDLVALGLTVGAVLAISRERPFYVVAGALIGLAALAKPTALAPAVALFVFVARRDPLAALRVLGAGAVATAVVFVATQLPNEMWRMHVIDWNALSWRFELLSGLVIVAVLVLAVPIATVFVTRSFGGATGAYLVGAIGVLALGGREGATINYFLDLSAALALAAACVAPRLAVTAAYPIASFAQLALAAALLNPLPGVPSVLQPTGKWGDPTRIAFVRDNIVLWPGPVLVEDSGLVVANGREPLVDDLFLWSRLEATGRIDGTPLLDAVRAGTFDAIVSEVELERIDLGPGSERQRWHPELVSAVLSRYAVSTHFSGLCEDIVRCQQLYIYTRR